MAIIHYEHFDLYGTDMAALAARGYVAVSGQITNGARNGNYCFRAFQSSSDNVRWTLPQDKIVAGQGVALFLEATPSNAAGKDSHGIRFIAADRTIHVVMNPDLGVSVYSDWTLLGHSAPALIAVQSWFWLEAEVVSGADGNASVEVRLGNTPVLTLPNLSFPSPWSSVFVGAIEAIGTNACRYDDWIVWDDTDTVNNSFLGDTFVLVGPPNADGTPNDFVPSTGTARWAMIDEAVPDDNDFISGGEVGAVNEFAHVASNLPAGSVAAIATQVRAFKTDAGSSSLEVGLSSGGQASMSGERALGTGALVFSHIANKNPNGNVPWTQAAAQAARMRLRRAA